MNKMLLICNYTETDAMIDIHSPLLLPCDTT